jgi:periplasmic protein CpxP/Spy
LKKLQQRSAPAKKNSADHTGIKPLSNPRVRLMMKMKFTLALLLLFAGFSVCAQDAQQQDKQKQTPEQRATMASDTMAARLGLSADQKSKVYELVLNREKQMDALREKYKGQDKKAWESEREAVRNEFITGLKKVLTAEQYEKWRKMKHRAAHRR